VGRALPHREQSTAAATTSTQRVGHKIHGAQRSEAGATLQSLDRDAFAINYHMLQVWDLLSLYLCGGKHEAQTFEPVPTGYDGPAARGLRLSVTPIDETRLSIDPYPFDVRPFRVCYAYKQLRGRLRRAKRHSSRPTTPPCRSRNISSSFDPIDPRGLLSAE
jgi:hypothetical protein